MTAKERELRAYMLGRAHGMIAARSHLRMRASLSPDTLSADVSRFIADAVMLANDPARAKAEGWEVPR